MMRFYRICTSGEISTKEDSCLIGKLLYGSTIFFFAGGGCFYFYMIWCQKETARVKSKEDMITTTAK